MPRCMYCLNEKTNDHFRKAEHVLPQSFGRFENNFTLRDSVCDECNQYFGDNLELALARDTYEGHLRFSHRVKDQAEFRPFGSASRIVMRVLEGPFEGAFAYRQYSPQAAEVVIQPLPQVGFLMSGSGKYAYFLLDDLPTEQELRERGFDSQHQRAICGIAVDGDTLRAKLEERGITFQRNGEVVPPQQSQSLLCEMEGSIDQQIFRAVAKIAFNYLLYWQGPAFLSKESFDAARRYIRYGENPGYRMVAIRQEAILADEPIVGRRRLGHLITTGWARDGVSIIGQVSIFNWVTYSVSLLRDYRGEHRNVTRGHFFDVANRQILEMGSR